MSDAKQSRKNLENFQVDHHETLLSYYKEKTEWWHRQTDVEKQRCKVCWLRVHQCYCETLKHKRAVYEAWTPKPNIKVCIYYNAVEIARSANTAHCLEATCPEVCYSIVQGDLEKERALMDDIEREYRENEPQTCIMFPSKDAKLLSEWMDSRPAASQDKPIRLVMLDGTFPGAARIAKYMINCCSLRGIPAPLVKLDLEGDACKSAVAGMMYQPGKDKICTYQATVMAMQQARVDPALCALLHQDLQDWIGYILKTKVKLGKTKPRNSMKHVMDVTPDEFIAQTLKETQGRGEERADKHIAHQSNAHKKKGGRGSDGNSSVADQAVTVVQRLLTVAAARRNSLLVGNVEFEPTARFLVLSVTMTK